MTSKTDDSTNDQAGDGISPEQLAEITDAEWLAITDACPLWEHVETAVHAYGRRVAADVLRTLTAQVQTLTREKEKLKAELKDAWDENRMAFRRGLQDAEAECQRLSTQLSTQLVEYSDNTGLMTDALLGRDLFRLPSVEALHSMFGYLLRPRTWTRISVSRDVAFTREDVERALRAFRTTNEGECQRLRAARDKQV